MKFLHKKNELYINWNDIPLHLKDKIFPYLDKQSKEELGWK